MSNFAWHPARGRGGGLVGARKHSILGGGVALEGRLGGAA